MEHEVITIGPGWSDDPDERRAQVFAQEQLVSDMAEIMDEIGDWELDG